MGLIKMGFFVKVIEKNRYGLREFSSSNKPGFVDFKVNKGIDENRLKGGLEKE
jgi:hypothetical protein